jgi:hypothetical protein
MSDRHLFRFGYSSPDELEWVETHPDHDLGEWSEAVFICAGSTESAAAIGEDVAEAFVRRLYGARSYSWREIGFASWIDDDTEIIEWAEQARLPTLERGADIAAVVEQMVTRASLHSPPK